MHLVLADDSPAIQKVVQLSFASEDIDVHCYADGHSTLDHLKSRPADVLLADVSLPGIDGYQLCQTVRDDPRTARIPVVLLVGAFEQLDVQRAQQAGYDLGLTKPLGTSELVDLVRDLLERSSRPPAPAARPAVVQPDGEVEPAGEDLAHDRDNGQDKGVVFTLTASQCRAAPPAFTRVLIHPDLKEEPGIVHEERSVTVPELEFDPEAVDRLVGRLLESLKPELQQLVQDALKRHQS